MRMDEPIFFVSGKCLVLTFQTDGLRHGVITAVRRIYIMSAASQAPPPGILLSLRSREPISRAASNFKEQQVC